MSQINVIYGCIEGPAYYEDTKLMNRLNRETIAALPENGTFTPDMFAIPDDTHSHEVQTISFSGSYRQGIISYWESWLEEFEGLLRRLYWEIAYLHLIGEIAGVHQYRWEMTGPPDAFQGNPPALVTEWAFSGGPRSFGD